MKVYGITGGAGTGKSEVIKMLQQNFGGCVIMSDEVARELMQKGNISYQLIVEYFGRDILMDDGEIDRKKLADHVFNNKEALEKLNSMTHPYVKDEIRKLIAEAEASPVSVVLWRWNLPFFLNADMKISVMNSGMCIRNRRSADSA